MQIRIGLPILAAGLALLLVGCGGSSGGPDPADPDGPIIVDDGPIVEPVSCSTDPTADGCESETTQLPELLSVGSTRSGSVARGEGQSFRVPSGAQISVISLSGDADLFLFSSADFSTDTLLCATTWPVAEDNCTATYPDGDLYAEVYGSTAAEFTISVTDDCSVEAVNEWVYRNMQDYYLYADEVPVVNPANYTTSSELVRELSSTLDPFSGISDASTRQAFFQEGEEFGFGARYVRRDDNFLVVAFVDNNSPFANANIQRGDVVISINGELEAEISGARYRELIGDSDNPLTTVWRFVDGVSGEFKEASLVQSAYTLDTVLHSTVYTNDSFSGRTGYFVFTDFIQKSESDLDAVFNDFISRGITELVLDLRYNGGGLVEIANRLGSQLGGPELDGEVIQRWQHNAKYAALNSEDTFTAATPSLDLDRLVVIAGPGTASASEAVINGLRPYMDVVVIGERTRGKPFVSRSKRFCGLALNIMEGQGVNANNVSVAGGIPADCYAEDDTSRRFGGSGADIEGALGKALDYVVFGTCDAAPVFAKHDGVEDDLLTVLNQDQSTIGSEAASYRGQ